MRYASTKTYGHEVGLSCAFRQWRAKSHCSLIHGYAIAVRVEFEADTLDERNWVQDFGDLKWLKEWLAERFDHSLLVAEDDPELDTLSMLTGIAAARVIVLPAVGCEAFAQQIYEFIDKELQIRQYTNGLEERVKVASVEVREHGANSAIYRRN